LVIAFSLGQIHLVTKTTFIITSPTLYNITSTTTKMPVTASTNSRQRLSVITNSKLGNDVSAAFKASNSMSSRATQEYGETPAPPPSPIDFSFPSTPAEQRSPSGSDRS
jgi:hypothetical protein